MKLTILETGAVPAPLRPRFVSYPEMFEALFTATGLGFTYETVAVADGASLPDPARLEGIVITGSPAGVYDDLPWIEPLRGFIRTAYAQNIAMAGICFGHQIMADALGGDVRKSDKGWGLGRHLYTLAAQPSFMPGFMAPAPDTLAVACSHQDQVIVPPATAKIILTSDFTPNAGLFYKNGAALSFQPHPEFTDDYALELVEMRRDLAPEGTIATALDSFAIPSNSADMGVLIGQFFNTR